MGRAVVEDDTRGSDLDGRGKGGRADGHLASGPGRRVGDVHRLGVATHRPGRIDLLQRSRDVELHPVGRVVLRVGRGADEARAEIGEAVSIDDNLARRVGRAVVPVAHHLERDAVGAVRAIGPVASRRALRAYEREGRPVARVGRGRGVGADSVDGRIGRAVARVHGDVAHRVGNAAIPDAEEVERRASRTSGAGRALGSRTAVVASRALGQDEVEVVVGGRARDARVGRPARDRADGQRRGRARAGATQRHDRAIVLLCVGDAVNRVDGNLPGDQSGSVGSRGPTLVKDGVGHAA